MYELNLKELAESIYKSKDFTSQTVDKKSGEITEQDRLGAAKQILFGLAVLYTATILAYVFWPQQGMALLEIAKMAFPPLATLIIAFYFKDRNG